jgi:hypothetical protein
MEPMQLEPGMIVQLNPKTTGNPMFRGCLMTVTDPKPWGAQGYVQSLGENQKMGGQAYYRSKWEDMELVGRAVWEIGREPDADPGQPDGQSGSGTPPADPPA